jgi:hypothetical protein
MSEFRDQPTRADATTAKGSMPAMAEVIEQKM